MVHKFEQNGGQCGGAPRNGCTLCTLRIDEKGRTTWIDIDHVSSAPNTGMSVNLFDVLPRAKCDTSHENSSNQRLPDPDRFPDRP